MSEEEDDYYPGPSRSTPDGCGCLSFGGLIALALVITPLLSAHAWAFG